ncbi:hypothetical protein OC835_000642 [Tilletia horrida]|nr:hypothetical protein OC835_000642 [Tilletia horrida]
MDRAAHAHARPPLQPTGATTTSSSSGISSSTHSSTDPTSTASSSSSSSSSGGGYTFGLGNAYFTRGSISSNTTAPSPALSASASSYDGSAYDSEFDSDLNALSLDDLDPDAPQHPSQQLFGSPLQRPHRSRSGHASGVGVGGTSSARRRSSSRDSVDTSMPSGVETEEEAQSEAESAAFDAEDEDEADMHAEGVPAAWGFKLDARTWETMPFQAAVLELLSKRLALAGWAQKDVHPSFQPLQAECVHLKRISGAMSNAVFFVSYRTQNAASSPAAAPGQADESPSPPPTILLRVYGTGTEVLLSRRAELLILHTLSSLYSIGPHILGTFANGRVEEYFDCVPIGKEGLRALGDRGGTLITSATKEADLTASLHGKEGTAQWVARRMRELHEVPLDVMKTVLERGDLHAPGPKGFGRGIENHIMASSHRPRRHRPSHHPGSSSHRPSVAAAAPDRTPPGAAQGALGLPFVDPKDKRSVGPGEPADTSIAAIAAEAAREQAIASHKDGEGTADYLNIPSRPPLTTLGSGSDSSYGYVQGRNNSVASFDSLATSYNSHTSSWSGSDAAVNSLYPSGGPTSPWPFVAPPDSNANPASQTSYGSSVDGAASQQQQFMGFTSPKSPFLFANKSIPPTPNGVARSVTGLEALQQHQRSPYPGVWRRMKRWSREAGKVIGLVDAFCSTPEGRAAAERALGHPLQDLATRASGWTSRDIGTTKGNLGNALRAIAAIDLASFVLQLDSYKDYVRRVERREGQSKRVFAHNDSQYGNLLIKKSAQLPAPAEKSRGPAKSSADKTSSKKTGSVPSGSGGRPSLDGTEHGGREVARGMPRERSGSIAFSPALGPSHPQSRSSSRSRREAPHQALVVIDFEYAAPNPRGFDIANHFQEWRTDYHHPTLSWSLTHHGPYPNESERRRWLRAYVEQGRFLRLRVGASKLPVPEAPASSGRNLVKSPRPMQQPTPTSELDELEALPPPAVPVTAGAGAGVAEPLPSQEVQRAALEQSSGLRPGLSRAPSSQNGSSGGAVRGGDSLTPPAKNSTPSPSTPQSKATQTQTTPSLASRRPSASQTQSPNDTAVRSGGEGGGLRRPAVGAGRTIKVTNSPALKALYSPTLSPFLGPSGMTAMTPTGEGQNPLGSAGAGSGSFSAASEASAALAKLEMSIEKEVDRIEREVWLWGPACHAVWSLWGIVFAKEEIEQLLKDALNPDAGSQTVKASETKTQAEGEGGDVDTFDYLRYALGRIELFREETASMSIQPSAQ